MRPWIIWSFVVFNLAVLLWVIWLSLVDSGVLPGRPSSSGMFGRYFAYEMIALLAIMVNLVLAILAVLTRRR